MTWRIIRYSMDEQGFLALEFLSSLLVEQWSKDAANAVNFSPSEWQVHATRLSAFGVNVQPESEVNFPPFWQGKSGAGWIGCPAAMLRDLTNAIYLERYNVRMLKMELDKLTGTTVLEVEP